MRLSIIAASLLSAFAAVPAFAAEEPASAHTVTGNMTLASEYIYRGIAQTNRKPAIQGGLDYSHSSGLYLGAWASNISWLTDAQVSGVSAPIEIDTYGGYKLALGDVTLDFGVLKYWYPGTYPAGYVSADTLEFYTGASYKFLTFKYSRSTTNLFGATSTQDDGSIKKTEGSQYFDLSANPELGGGFVLNLHAGRQLVANHPGASYNDYKIGVTKDIGGFAVSAAYITTTAKAEAGAFYRSALNRDLGADRIVVSVGKTF